MTFFEGESIVLLAGVAVGAGQLAFDSVVLCAVAGSVSGDQLWFYLGRRWGTRLIAPRASWVRATERIAARLRSNQILVMLTFRFYYGLRSITPTLIGASRVPPLRFLGLNLVGAVIWALTFTYGGYVLGDKLIRHFEWISRWGPFVVAALVVGALVAVHLGTSRAAGRATNRE